MDTQIDLPSGTPQPMRLVWTPELVERFWGGVAQTPMTESSFPVPVAPPCWR